jgi:ribosomal protein S8
VPAQSGHHTTKWIALFLNDNLTLSFPLFFLLLSLNKCGVISPRYDVSHHDLEDWVSRLLPSRLFGVIVLTTSAGIMDHEEARRKKVGGKILGFFY